MAERDKYREAGLEKIKFLEERGIDPYPGEMPEITHLATDIRENFNRLEGTKVSIAGRLTGIREHGKRVFLDIQDESGKLQSTFTDESLGQDQFDIFKGGYSNGDFIFVSGDLIKTKRGEISVNTTKIKMLAKSILPPPSKWDGLKNVETRTRQRYLDLMMNQEVKDRFIFRSKMVESMRQTFLGMGCYEVETPVLDSTYGGASARPFETHHNALDTKLFLRISNELYLKRLLVGGLGGVFEFSRDFRNEGMDKTHNPEFTQVELYKAYTDYNYMMTMSENLISGIAQKLLGKQVIEYQGKTINLKTPWKRLSIYDGVREAYKIDPENISDKDLLNLAKKEGITETDRGYILLELFDKKVSPNLVDPTFVIDYPESTSPLTKKHRAQKGLVERFETVVAGMEVMNCYTELNDPRKQRQNFVEELNRRMAGDDQAMQTDDDFVIAMEYGMPPMGGIGISIDRWTMLLTNADHIRETILFPTMKPVKK